MSAKLRVIAGKLLDAGARADAPLLIRRLCDTALETKRLPTVRAGAIRLVAHTFSRQPGSVEPGASGNMCGFFTLVSGSSLQSITRGPTCCRGFWSSCPLEILEAGLI